MKQIQQLLTRLLLIIICIISLPFIYSSYGQGFQVNVIDNESQIPLEGVHIRTESRAFEVYTDENGQAHIRGVASDEYIFISLDNYRDRFFTFKEIIQNGNLPIVLERIEIPLPILTISGYSRGSLKRKLSSNQIGMIKSKDVELLNPSNSADMLANHGIAMQKSQMGGGSPIIRGFEANKLLIVIDGIRLNNAIYRNGHLQNVITIDNAVLDRTEIIQGPASVVYGSDALGGVIHFITKEPKLAISDNKDEYLEGSSYIRHSTANKEKAFHFDFNYGTKKLAMLSSITFSKFEDLRVGANGMKDYPGYGLSYFHVERFSAQDTVLTNPNPLVQKNTGYWQFDALHKVKYQYSKKLTFGLNFQYSTTSDVPRFDQLNLYEVEENDTDILTDNDTIPRFATWNYGPQKRLLLALNARYLPDDIEYFDELNVILSTQKVDEDRIKRRLDKLVEEHQNEDVYVVALNADFTKKLNKIDDAHLLYGTEIFYNKVFSTSKVVYVDTDIEIPGGTQTRYPNGGSDMFSASVFGNYHQTISEKLNVMAGGRYTYSWLNSVFLPSNFINLPVDTISFNDDQFTFSLSGSYQLSKGFYVDAVISTAFRSPNVDDFGKVRSNGGYVTVPNADLGAEKSLNGEISLTKDINDKVIISGTYFYTYLFDAIVRDYFTLIDPITGLETNLLYLEGSYDTIQANINSGRAYINGISASAKWNILKNIQLQSSINIIKGVDVSKGEPLAHIPPVYGQTSLTYRENKFEITMLSRYNGWKRLEDYAPGSSDNLEYATPDGTPSWITFNTYFKYVINRKTSVNFACENILDRHYRSFSSGISAPGRNFIFTLRRNLNDNSYSIRN